MFFIFIWLNGLKIEVSSNKRFCFFCIKGKQFYFILRSFIHLSSFTNIWLRKTAQKNVRNANEGRKLEKLNLFLLSVFEKLALCCCCVCCCRVKGISRRVKFNEEEIFCAFVIKLILFFILCLLLLWNSISHFKE